jgi:Ca-activated chloride channel homolog
MRLRAVIALAALGATTSSAVAFAVPIDQQSRALTSPPASLDGPDRIVAEEPPSHVNVGRTLLLDARLGHASVPAGRAAETYLFASVTAADALAKAPPVDLAVVIDRSGSMKGARISNAIAGAIGAVDRMRDGDRIVVVSFDTEAQVVVPVTAVSSSTRPAIEGAIRSIRLGGDTCISCGLMEARRQLDAASSGPTRITRTLLLSDGATNHGVVDLPGLRSMATRMRDRGAISTIGVDVDFDEKVMSALAIESNGNHYFVGDAAALPSVFNTEFDTLVATMARDADVVIDPAPGVEVEEIFDRPARREGNRVVIPLGSFSARDEKSALVKLKVPADRDGTRPVVEMKLVYHDLVEHGDQQWPATLSLAVKNDGSAQAELDPFVRARVERSTTARALAQANDLINQGRFAEAQASLVARSAALKNAQAAADKAPPVAPAPVRARGFKKDFDDQNAALDRANQVANSAATAAPSSRTAKEAPKVITQDIASNPFR